MASEQTNLTKRAIAKKVVRHIPGLTKDLGSLAVESVVVAGHLMTAAMDRITEDRREGRLRSDRDSDTAVHLGESHARMRETFARIGARLGFKPKRDASFSQVVDSVMEKADELGIPVDRPKTLEDLQGLANRMPEVERAKDR